MRWYHYHPRITHFSPDEFSYNTRFAASYVDTHDLHMDLQDAYRDRGGIYNESLKENNFMPYANSRTLIQSGDIDPELTHHMRPVIQPDLRRLYGTDPERFSEHELNLGDTLHAWNARSSQSSSIRGTALSNLAYLQAAQRVFPELTHEAMTDHLQGGYWERVKQLLRENPEMQEIFEQVLHAEYAHTQQALKDHGAGDVIRLYRGMGIPGNRIHQLPEQIQNEVRDIKTSKEPVMIHDVPFKLAPISSFTQSPTTALNLFSSSELGTDSGLSMISHIDVPRERILSTPFTGRGVNDEREYTVIGGNDLKGHVSVVGGGNEFNLDNQKLNDFLYK